MRWPATVKARPEPGGIAARAVTGWRCGMDRGRALFHGNVDGKYFRFAGWDEMQAELVLGRIGRPHPRLDAIIRRVVTFGPGDDGGIGGRHLGIAETQHDIAGP